jgi:hypothetical protein
MRTCEVQTLFRMTNVKVCTNHVNTRSFLCLAKSSPAPRLSAICGTKLVRGDRSSLCQNDVDTGDA